MFKNIGFAITTIYLLVIVVSNTGFCWDNSNELLEKGDVAMGKDSEYNVERYRNISTAPSFIKIKFKKRETGEILNIIIENEDMASYLAFKQGLKTDNLGRFKDIEAYKKFIEDYYVAYMVENEGKLLDIDFNDFKKFIGKTRFGNEKAAGKYLDSRIFINPLTLQELNVNNENEFIKEYFDFDSNKGYGTLKKDYYKQFNSNPAFIALLIDLGYNVGRGDIAPILFIRKSL